MGTPQAGPLTLGSLQVVAGGLMTGVVGLLAVALLVRPPSAASFTLSETRTIWLGGVAAVVTGAVVLVVVLGRLLTARAAASARREGRGEGELLGDFGAFTIVRCAVVEGVGLLGVTIYLIADLGVGLVIAGLSLLGLLALFPTASRQRAFEEQAPRPE